MKKRVINILEASVLIYLPIIFCFTSTILNILLLLKLTSLQICFVFCLLFCITRTISKYYELGIIFARHKNKTSKESREIVKESILNNLNQIAFVMKRILNILQFVWVGSLASFVGCFIN